MRRSRHWKISIHALLAESDFQNQYLAIAMPISIHALLAESDGWPSSASFQRAAFLSTLSLRRATAGVHVQRLAAHISIHALLAESDGHKRPLTGHALAISIHALLAESDATSPANFHNVIGFLSTLSLRRATQQEIVYAYVTTISIHALLAESDLCSPSFALRTAISIHALLAESDALAQRPAHRP